MTTRRTYLLSLSCFLFAGSLVAQPCAIDIGPDATICQGQDITLFAPAGFPNYLWSTGSNATSITVSTAGTYWGQASYPTGELATNGNFSAGNTGFTAQFNYDNTLTTDGNYFIGANAATYHPQFLGTGNGAFLMINAGWMHSGWDAWCNTIDVCPEQTYTLSVRAMSLASQGPPLLDWAVDGVQQGLWMQTGSQGSWTTFTNTWTSAPGQTSATFCVKIASGHGIGNDLGLDDISISSTIVLRDQMDLTVTPLPVVDLGPDATLCVGQNLVLDAAVPGGSYLWQDGSVGSSYVVSSPGNYSVTVTANGCSASDAIDVNYNALPVVDLGPDITLCAGQSTTLDATVPGATYGWQDGSSNPTFNVTGPGTYSVNVTANGCSTSDAIDVYYNPNPVIDLGPDLVVCAGTPVLLDATTPGATYLWQDGSMNATYTPVASGAYGVIVTVNGCTASDVVNVTITPLPVVNLGPDQTICPGTSVLLDASITGGSYLWQDGSTDATYDASAPGMYSVTVTANGCSTSDSFTLSHHTLPVVALGPDLTFCAGQSATIGSAVPGATYAWSTGASSATINVGTAGILWQDVTLNGCTVRDSIEVFVNPLPTVDLGADRWTCPGVDVLLDATTPSATYLWSTGAVGATINAGPGNYDVTVTVAGCSSSDAVFVNAWPAAQIDLGNDTTLCPGEQLMLDATQAGASYFWQNGSVAASFNVSAAGTYDVTLTDGNGCIATDAINVSYATPSAVDLGPDSTICQGSTITLDATLPGASYLWSTGAVSPTIQTGLPGNYSVTVTQGNCSVTDAVDVLVASLPLVALGNDTTLCPGEQVVLDATGAGLSYLWNTGAVTPTLTITSAGTFDVTVTNAANCTASDAIDVAYASPSSVDLGPDITLCQGESVTLDATLPGASYLWSTGAITPTLSIGAAGQVWVEVTQGACSVSDTVQITVNPVPLADLGPDVTLCAGEDVVLDATWPGATYLWNTGATSATITASATGTYSVDVDLNGCVASDNVEVTVLSSTSLDLGPDVVLCDGEQAILDATTAGASYLWSNAATTPTITISASGIYWAQVTVGQCSTSDTVLVLVAPVPLVDLGPDRTICAGEQALLDATWPGATYLWNDGSTDPTLMASSTGTFSVEVSTGGCVGTDDVVVTVLSPDAVDLGADITACEGTPIVLDATTPGATYLWSTGATTATVDVQVTGSYWVEVSQGGCGASDTVMVQLNPAPTMDLGPDLTLCDGETSTVLDATWPGATYLWSTGATSATLSVNTSGTYAVDVELNGCVASDAIDVNFGSLTVDLGPDTSLCPGHTLVLTGPTDIGVTTWNGVLEASSFTVDAAGTYWVDFLALSGCTATDTIVVDYAQPGSLDLGADQFLCEGNSIELNATVPGATVEWEDGSTNPVRTVTTTGTYTVEAIVGECILADAITVTFNPNPVVDLGGDVALCPGATTLFDVTTANASYLWHEGSIGSAFETGQAGDVSVTVTVDGCSASDEASVSLLVGPSLDLGNDTTICEGAELTLDVNEPGATYLWDDGSTSALITVTNEATRWVEVTRNGCVQRDSITVSVFSPSNFDLGDDRIVCSGSTTEFDATMPGATYLWNTGATSASIVTGTAGSYSVVITVSGCTAQDQVQVEVLSMEVPDLGPDLRVCDGEVVELSVDQPATSILWSTGATGSSILVGTSGTYTVTLDSLGCTSSDAIVVDVLAFIDEIDLGPDRELCPGAIEVIEATPIPGANYLWSTGAVGSMLSIMEPGTYEVAVSGDCIDASATVVISPGDCATYVFIPNTFTPNGDGINERFQPSFAGPVDEFQMDIFDRWGEVIHSTDDRNAGWDGMFNGTLSQDGVYIWRISYRVLAAEGVKAETLTGHVNLLR